VWEAPQNVAKGTEKQMGKATSTFKKWKNHLQDWGLDTSYNHSLSLSGRLNTNGWSLGLIYQVPVGDEYDRRKGKHAGQFKFWQLNFSEVKHEKQVKQQKENTTYPEFGQSAPFVYGKINNLYLLQLGYGREQLILPGVLEGNISVSFRYSAGFSLAMLKPYYLKLLHTTVDTNLKVTIEEEKYSDQNAELFLNRDRIFGGSKWGKGVGETNYVPGAYIEGAFAIVPSKNKTFIQVVTLGGQLSAYAKSLPVMAERKADPYMGALFVGLSLGKRWR
jgi:hypothetical protein